MVAHLEAFQQKLEQDFPHHEKQIIKAAIVELKASIVVKTRDIKRRIREL